MDTHTDSQEKIIDEDDKDGGWVDTHHYGGTEKTDITEQVAEMTLDSVSFWQEAIGESLYLFRRVVGSKAIVYIEENTTSIYNYLN